MLGISDNRKTGCSRHKAGKMVFDKCAMDVSGKQTISREIYILIYKSKKAWATKRVWLSILQSEEPVSKRSPICFPGCDSALLGLSAAGLALGESWLDLPLLAAGEISNEDRINNE